LIGKNYQTTIIPGVKLLQAILQMRKLPQAASSPWAACLCRPAL